MSADDALVVWELQSCEGDNFYDRGAMYDDFDEMVAQMRQELDEGRHVIVERQLITRAEFDALPKIEGMEELKF